jgi:hypothetical protein
MSKENLEKVSIGQREVALVEYTAIKVSINPSTGRHFGAFYVLRARIRKESRDSGTGAFY